MGRNDNELYITIPSVFRCPISLDVMKSPVSLCTGVTYDRSSIQHWLDSGHDTCPATMQVLSSKDVVPNLTLHRLINLWHQHHRATLPPPPPPPPVASDGLVKVWIDEIVNLKFDSLVKIVEFLNYSDKNKKFLAEFDGFLETLIVSFGKKIKIRDLELLIRILDLILNQNGVKEKLQRLVNKDCLNSIILLFDEGSLQSNDVVLSFLVAIITTRSIKTQLVQLGLVRSISKLFTSRNVSVLEKLMRILSILVTCADGRLAISTDEQCVVSVVEKLMKVNKTATEDGVMVLWSLCCLFKDERVKEKVVKCKGLTKILLVMQSDQGDGNVRRMCVDLVKVLRIGVKDNDVNGDILMCYETKTTHIMPC